MVEQLGCLSYFFCLDCVLGFLKNQIKHVSMKAFRDIYPRDFKLERFPGYIPRGFKLERFPGYIPRDFKFIFRDFKLERFGGGRAAQKNMSNKSNMKVIVRMIIYQFHCLVFCMTLE